MRTLTKAGAVLAAVAAILAGCGSEPVQQDQRSQSAEATTTASPLQGTFRYESTRDELVGSELLMDGGEISDGNWGMLTMTFDGDTVQFHQENKIESSSTAGTFTTDDGLLTLTMTTGDNTGETFSMRYTLDGDTLVLTRDPDWEAKELIGPTPMVLKPWTRIA